MSQHNYVDLLELEKQRRESLKLIHDMTERGLQQLQELLNQKETLTVEELADATQALASYAEILQSMEGS